MTVADDLKLRDTNATWFEGETGDVDGHPVKMYSVVTPVEEIEQYYASGEEPIVLSPGIRLVVCGAADGNIDWLWLDVDDPRSPFADADVCLAKTRLRYLCEVGEDLHMKGFSQ